MQEFFWKGSYKKGLIKLTRVLIREYIRTSPYGEAMHHNMPKEVIAKILVKQ